MQEDTRQKILDRGHSEFLAHGFKSASLREIAKAAGVTTGAIYGYFQDKSALFSALVEDAAKGLLEKFIDIQENFSQLSAGEQAESMGYSSEVGILWMVEYIYAHFDAFKLIVCRSDGTAYAGYIDRLVEIEVESTYRFIATLTENGVPLRLVDDDLMHILANALFSGLFEIVAHDMPKQKAEEYIERLREFYTAGWRKILGID